MFENNDRGFGCYLDRYTGIKKTTTHLSWIASLQRINQAEFLPTMSTAKGEAGGPGKHNKPVEPQWRSDAAIASLNSTGVGAPRDAAEGEVRAATSAKVSSKKAAKAPSENPSQKTTSGNRPGAAAKASEKSQQNSASRSNAAEGGSANVSKNAKEQSRADEQAAAAGASDTSGSNEDDGNTNEVHANSNPTKALESEMELEAAYAKNPSDLNIAFDLLSILIVRYRLNRSDEILNEIEAICMKDQFFKLRFHQSKAFVRYKQARYLECIAEFVAQENLMVLGIAGMFCLVSKAR